MTVHARPFSATVSPIWEEWRGGWKVVLAAAFGMSIATFPTYTHGAMAPKLAEQFGWTEVQLSMAITLTALVGAVFAPLVGRAADRFGARGVALGGLLIALAGLGQIGFTIGHGYASYVTAWLIAAVCSTPAGAMIWIIGVTRSFARARGLAIAIALCGTGLMGGCQAMAARLLVDHYGWQTAYKLLALGTVVITLAVTWAFFRLPGERTDASHIAPQPQTGLTLKVALQRKQFWLLAVILLLTGGPITGLLVNLVQLHQKAGLTPMEASGLLGTTAATVIIARLMTGALLDRIHGIWVALLEFTSAALSAFLLLAYPGDLPVAIAAAILFGIAVGAEFDLISYLASRYFGLRHFGAIYGWLFAIFAIAQGLGPVAVALSVDWTGGYALALYSVAALYAGGALLALFLGPYPRSFDGGSDAL